VSPALARRSLPELPLAAVLLVCALGLLVVYLHHFRLGSLVIACGVLLASALRLSVSARRAGLLVVRSRALDVTVLAALGVAVLVLALVVPSMHP
jgi:Protein of unknown function (DUF3017)